MQPFLKWAGGKRWLIHSGQLAVPSEYVRLVEPFLGGGAVFFGLEPKQALLSDVNPELINLYEIVRDAPDRLMSLLHWHQDRHDHSHYYAIRARRYKDRVWRAARTLYLNRTCWNGLYRLNKQGDFNVPIGTKTAVVLEPDFSKISDILRRVELSCCDFEDSLDQATAGDFVFIDPPYTVKHNLNGFLKYNESIFSWEDQVRLRQACVRAAQRGASVVVTNADHESVRALYAGVAEYQSVSRASVLAGKADFRSQTTEAVFLIDQ